MDKKPKTHFHIMQYIISSPDSPEIDDTPIRRRLCTGLDECPPDDRCLSWLIVLGIYTKNPAEWPRKLHKLKEEYKGYVEDLGLEDWINKDIPISVSESSYFQVPNKHVMQLIHGDIVRTGRHIFFLTPSSIAEPRGDQESDIFYLYSKHLRRMERILYVLAMLNKSISYMQGFNELIQPLYNVVSSSAVLFNNDFFVVECLAFNMLLTLLNNSNLMYFFRTQNSAEHLVVQLKRFNEILKELEPQIFRKINKIELHPACYCFRWFCLLFAQEFSMPDLLPLWDSILAHFGEICEYSYCVGVGLLKEMKAKILASDYANIIEMFQNLDSKLVPNAIKYANNAWSILYPKSKLSNV
jgi:hypothetical protein